MDIINYAIQSPGGVFRDLKRNRGWILFTLIVIAIWAVISTFWFFSAEEAAQTARLAEMHSTGLPFTIGSSAYFTIINLTTVGFGDIVPLTERGRDIAILNSLTGLFAFGVVVAQVTAAFQSEQPDNKVYLAALLSGLEVGRNDVEILERRDRKPRRFRISIEPIDDQSPQADDIARSSRS